MERCAGKDVVRNPGISPSIRRSKIILSRIGNRGGDRFRVEFLSTETVRRAARSVSRLALPLAPFRLSCRRNPDRRLTGPRPPPRKTVVRDRWGVSRMPSRRLLLPTLWLVLPASVLLFTLLGPTSSSLRADDAAPAATPEGVEFFEKKIRPLFVKHCTECHSADSPEPEGDLRLDTAAGWRRGDTAARPSSPATQMRAS